MGVRIILDSVHDYGFGGGLGGVSGCGVQVDAMSDDNEYCPMGCAGDGGNHCMDWYYGDACCYCGHKRVEEES